METALNPDEASARYLHRQIDAETREQIRELQEEVADLKLQLQIERHYRESHADTIKTLATLVNAGIGVRYAVVVMIAVLSMIGGMKVAYDTLEQWFGGK